MFRRSGHVLLWIHSANTANNDDCLPINISLKSNASKP